MNYVLFLFLAYSAGGTVKVYPTSIADRYPAGLAVTTEYAIMGTGITMAPNGYLPIDQKATSTVFAILGPNREAITEISIPANNEKIIELLDRFSYFPDKLNDPVAMKLLGSYFTEDMHKLLGKGERLRVEVAGFEIDEDSRVYANVGEKDNTLTNMESIAAKDVEKSKGVPACQYLEIPQVIVHTYIPLLEKRIDKRVLCIGKVSCKGDHGLTEVDEFKVACKGYDFSAKGDDSFSCPTAEVCMKDSYTFVSDPIYIGDKRIEESGQVLEKNEKAVAR